MSSGQLVREVACKRAQVLVTLSRVLQVYRGWECDTCHVQPTLYGVNLALPSHCSPLQLRSQPSRRLAPHQLLQFSEAHSAPPPRFPSLVPLELGLDVGRTLSSGHKLKGKPWVPQGLLFHPPFLSQEASVFFFTLGPDPEALRIAFPFVIQDSFGFSQGGSARGQGQERNVSNLPCCMQWPTTPRTAILCTPDPSKLSNTLPSAAGCPVPCCTPCLTPLSLTLVLPVLTVRTPQVTSVFSLLGAQPPRILELHSLGNATFLGFNPVRTYGDP